MNRLNKLLFAGTLVPAIALTPVAGAFAQAPDPQHLHDHGAGEPHPGGAMQPHPGGGTRGEGAMRVPAAGMERPGLERQRAAETRRPVAAPERAPQVHTPAAATATRTAPVGQPRRDAADPNAGLRRNGVTGQMTRPGAPGLAQHNVGNPAVAPVPHTNAVQDERRPSPGAAADRGVNPHPQAGQHGMTAGTPPARGPQQNAERHDHGLGVGGAVAIGAAAGLAGGFLAATGAQRLDQIRNDRREETEDGRTYIREPGRTIVEDGGRSFIVHDENDRFRQLGYDVHQERRGNDDVEIVDRPGGVQIVTYTDADGRMLRRVRRDRDGQEYVLIDNGIDGRVGAYENDVIDLPPPPMHIARDRYILDYEAADEGVVYDTLSAPPLAAPPHRYTLDQIRYSPDLRNYVRSVDINTINFETGSWIVPASATGKLVSLASAIKRVVARSPNSVFLVEGFTDAVGNPTDNLSLSDRRAQSVAAILTKSFNVPPENLTTQGYGQQNPKVNTSGPSAENRRVLVQNITQLLASGNQPAPQE